MDQHQKEQVLALRTSGKTCAHITGHLGLSVNTVKSFCRRNSLQAKTKAVESLSAAHIDERTACPQCGKKIMPISGRKSKRFCSDECRVRLVELPRGTGQAEGAVPIQMRRLRQGVHRLWKHAPPLLLPWVLLQRPFRQPPGCREGGHRMSGADFKREMEYESRMALARTMLQKGIVTKEEYGQINTIFLAKYRPLLGSLRAGKTPD